MYVRASYTDAAGKRHHPRRRAESRSQARRLLAALLAEIEEKQARPVDTRSTFKALADWYEATQAIEPVYAEANKVAGLRGSRTVL